MRIATPCERIILYVFISCHKNHPLPVELEHIIIMQYVYCDTAGRSGTQWFLWRFSRFQRLDIAWTNGDLMLVDLKWVNFEFKYEYSIKETYWRFVTHVPWCMPGSLPSGFHWSRWRGKHSSIPGTCATRNFAYLVRGQWQLSRYQLIEWCFQIKYILYC